MEKLSDPYRISSVVWDSPLSNSYLEYEEKERKKEVGHISII
jgi:hypothetical protein